MSRQDKTELADRDQQIIDDYKDGASVAELERTYGVSSRWIYVILKNAGVKLVRRRRRPLSPLHHHIAMLLREDTFDMGLERVAVANKLGWSYQKTSSAMQGRAELSILDLQLLSTFLKRDYNELMSPRRKDI